MKISFAWWNTSLSPTADSNRTDKEGKQVAWFVISKFLVERKIGLLGLCEMSNEDIEEIRKNCEYLGYRVINGASKIGRTKFDTCVIFRDELFELLDFGEMSEKWLNNTLKIAQRVDLKIKNSNHMLHVFLSHWPSVMTKNEGTPERDWYGHVLRMKVDRAWDAAGNDHVILMGDYNDEPFCNPLSFCLSATRDRKLIEGKPKRLYNPFWRRLGSSKSYIHSDRREYPAGTCFYKSHDMDRWKTYDQIIFSSNFLGSSTWHLDEASVSIVDIPEYTAAVLGKSQFDHLPVTATIEKV